MSLNKGLMVWRCAFLAISLWGIGHHANAQSIERNIVYGMASGSALLLDVHYPKQHNNALGVVFIPGSGWFADEHYGASALKDMNSGWQPGDELAMGMVTQLIDTGFTVFVVNHRAAPVFRFPVPVNDAARAVAFIRKNAQKFGIKPEKIGGAGTSSGGNLVSMLGSNNGINSNARLQSIVTLGSPMNLPMQYRSSAGSAGMLSAYIGHAINFLPQEHPHYQRYLDASPQHHFSVGDAPHFFIHGAVDELVPLEQSQLAYQHLETKGVMSKLFIVPGGMHSEHLLKPHDTWLDAMSSWFKTTLD